ncbi:hypothetical protein EJ02DRAFT_398525 [Clathrospora elynae]|uniref:N-acetyltransferase domain-containing protein n=1 Tax=Clathrospora elynae TaxID=706981 RepID=A0A6A5SV52_9PLEO|nr:hypothetical protein EJ02DRAFT_398525 [Clathrospora elynae]
MEGGRQPPQAEILYRAPSDNESVDYRIRAAPNSLQEDPDVEEDIVYRITPGGRITVAQVETCAKSFSSYYGVWGETAWRKMAQCLPDSTNNVLVSAMAEDDRQVGHCVVSQWAHGDDRVWWITQLLVLPAYRNQRRATRMLQTLTLHYDIGKKSDQNDFVGVASCQPYTICAILRVFGRGIESIPSKPDWEKSPSEHAHAPLESSKCAPLMSAAPVNYIHDATLRPKMLQANTEFLVDHTEPDDALRRVVHGMNKQMREPWEWLFGDLAEGHEYLCVLDFRHDPNYKMERQFCDRSEIPNEIQPVEEVEKSSTARSKPSSQPQNSVDYAGIDQYLLEFPGSCILDPRISHLTHKSTNRANSKRINEAKMLLAKQRQTLPNIMGAKRIPDQLRQAYRAGSFPLPEYMSSWRAFRDYAHEVFESDLNVDARLLILQAIHFQELLEDDESLRRGAERKRIEEERGQEKKNIKHMKMEQRIPLRSLTTNRTTALQRAKFLAKSSASASTSGIATPNSQMKPKLPSVSRLGNPRSAKPPARTPPKQLQSAKHNVKPSGPALGYAKVSLKSRARSEFTPISDVNKPPRTEYQQMTPPATPVQPAIAANTNFETPATGSTLRPETTSPQLFFSDSSSVGSGRSSVPMRRFPKNSGHILNRAKVEGVALGMRGRKAS